MTTNGKNDPERYAKMAAPYDDAQAAAAALDRFFAGLEELRNKHRIPEVIVVAAAHHKCGTAEDETHVFSTVMSGSWGNSVAAPDLAAHAYKRWVVPEIERARHLEAATKVGSDGDASSDR